MKRPSFLSVIWLTRIYLVLWIMITLILVYVPSGVNLLETFSRIKSWFEACCKGNCDVHEFFFRNVGTFFTSY